MVVGDYVYINHFCFIDGTYGLNIGEGCQIGYSASISTHSSHIAIRLYGKKYGGGNMVAYNKGSVEIGSYTFIGPNSIVMPGSQIGKGSLITAFSYVKGEFPDFAIISGNPAKVVGDTRKMDERHLQKHPELREFYDEWAKP